MPLQMGSLVAAKDISQGLGYAGSGARGRKEHLTFGTNCQDWTQLPLPGWGPLLGCPGPRQVLLPLLTSDAALTLSFLLAAQLNLAQEEGGAEDSQASGCYGAESAQVGLGL